MYHVDTKSFSLSREDAQDKEGSNWLTQVDLKNGR